MCGIAGIFDLAHRRECDREILNRMGEVQRHRGPDDSGAYVEPGLGLVHRRLSVIDRQRGGQPFLTRDSAVVVVHNGEVFNFRELRRELEVLGYTFRTDSDTEVIASAWQAWGEDCVGRLRGMFAFALWDCSSGTLFIARDRLGIKPLFYAVSESGHLVFGSELKALKVSGQLSLKLDTSAVEDYFAFGYIPDPKTIYRGVSKLPPGYHMTWRRGDSQGRLKQYWDIPFQVSAQLSEADAQQQLLERLSEAVTAALVADVPVGAFLSGGLDSSAVVSMMAKQTGEPINTCCIAFDDPRFDETQHAQAVACRYGTLHHSEQFLFDDPQLIDRLTACYDEPFADSSALPTLQVSALARRHVTVALSGDGGDELFAGYRRYRLHALENRVRGWLPTRLRDPVFRALGALYPKADWAPRSLRAKATLEALSLDGLEAYFHGVAITRPSLRASLWSPTFRSELQSYSAIEVIRQHAERSPTSHPLSIMQYIDMKTYLPGDILTKVDRASMFHGLEVRIPLLDHGLVEWASSLPPHLKLRRSQGKYLLKKALTDHLPSDVLARKKMGFSVPLANWLRGPLREKSRAAILGPVVAESGLFDMEVLKCLIDQHQSGLSDHSACLWSLMMFESFLRQQA